MQKCVLLFYFGTFLVMYKKKRIMEDRDLYFITLFISLMFGYTLLIMVTKDDDDDDDE